MSAERSLPPTTWHIEPPPDDHPDDLWAVGADLEPGTLVAAYRLGLFPMPLRETLGWFSPARRGVVPLEPFDPSRSLRRAAADATSCASTRLRRRRGGLRATRRAARAGSTSASPPRTVASTSSAGRTPSRPGTTRGSPEALYGVAIGGLFAAESMFHARTDASKAAFVGLVELLRGAGDADRRLLDVQWLTPHLASLGAVEVRRGVPSTTSERCTAFAGNDGWPWAAGGRLAAGGQIPWPCLNRKRARGDHGPPRTRRPMSFERPMKNSRRTIPSPITETRS